MLPNSHVLHGNEVDCDRCTVWEIPGHVQNPVHAGFRHDAGEVGANGSTDQLPLPHPKSTAAFGSSSEARISGRGGGYLPMTSMNMRC